MFKNRIYKCQVESCGKKYEHEAHLRLHMIIHNEPSKLFCICCQKQYTSVSNFNAHKKTPKHISNFIVHNKQYQDVENATPFVKYSGAPLPKLSVRILRLVSTDSDEEQLPNTASGTPKKYNSSPSFDISKSRHTSTDEVSAVTQTTPKIIFKPSKPPLPEPDDEETLEFKYYLFNFAIKKEKIEIAASSTPFICNLGSNSSKGNNNPQPTIKMASVAHSHSSSVFASDLETTQQSYMVAAPSDIESRLEITMMMDDGDELPGNEEASALPRDGNTEDIQNLQEPVQSPTEELSVDANDDNDDLIPAKVDIIIDDKEKYEKLIQRDYILRKKDLDTEGYNKISSKNSKTKINDERIEDEDCELEDLLCNLEEQVAMLRCRLSRHHNQSKPNFSSVETELKPPNRSMHRTRQATTQEKNFASTTVTRSCGRKRKNAEDVELEVQQHKQPTPAKIPNLEFYSSAAMHTASANLRLSNEEPQRDTGSDQSSTLTGSPPRHDYKIKDKFILTLTLDMQGTEQAGVGKRLLYYKHIWDAAEAN